MPSQPRDTHLRVASTARLLEDKRIMLVQDPTNGDRIGISPVEREDAAEFQYHMNGPKFTAHFRFYSHGPQFVYPRS